MESVNDKHIVRHMAWCRTMGEFEMKRRNDEKGYKNHHIWPSLRKKCFQESKYSYSHFFIPLQQKTNEDKFCMTFLKTPGR